MTTVILSKACTKCGEAKELSEFSSDKQKRDGLASHCKSCRSASAKAYCAANSEKEKARGRVFRAANSDSVKARQLLWVAANPEKVKATYEKWRDNNPAKVKAGTAAYRATNKDKLTARRIANKDKINAAHTVWRAANPDAVKAMQAAYYAANKERFSKYQADHKEKIQAYKALYYAENPEKFRIYSLNRRASKKATGKLSTGLAKKLYGLQQGKCPCCKQPLGDDYHLDHVIPLARGGVNADSNMQLLRAVCNMNKSAKDPLQFMQSRGFLL